MPRARNRLTKRPKRTTRSSPLSHGNGIDGRTTIYPATGSEYQSVCELNSRILSTDSSNLSGWD